MKVGAAVHWPKCVQRKQYSPSSESSLVAYFDAVGKRKGDGRIPAQPSKVQLSYDGGSSYLTIRSASDVNLFGHTTSEASLSDHGLIG
jgi:hypothetical protein